MEQVSAEGEIALPLMDLKVRDIGWQFPMDEFFSGASLKWCCIDGADLFLLDSRNTLHCLELARGVHRWVLNLPGAPTYPPGLCKDNIGIVIKDRLILAKRSNGSRFLDKILKMLPSTSPAVTEDGAYLGVFIQNRLYSIDSASGNTGWSFRFNDFITNSPKVYGEGAERFVYAQANDGAVICLPPKPALSAAPATTTWAFKTGGSNTAEIVFFKDNLFVASKDTSLYALNRLTGGIRWKYYAGIPLTRSPQVFDKYVFLKTDDNFLCLGLANGQEKWNLANGVEVKALINDVAYVWTKEGALTLVDAPTGKLMKEVPMKDGVCAIPNCSLPMLVMVSGKTIYGLK